MKLTLLDTGYISNETRASQTQLSDANRAGYTGSAVTSFTLDVINLSISQDSSIEQKPIINSLIDNSSSLVSVGPLVVHITVRWPREITTASWSVTKLHQFFRMQKTYGMKLLYPSATGDTLPSSVEDLGNVNLAGNFSAASPSDDNGTVATTRPYLLGRAKNFALTDTGGNNSSYRITFDFQVSG